MFDLFQKICLSKEPKKKTILSELSDVAREENGGGKYKTQATSGKFFA